MILVTEETAHRKAAVKAAGRGAAMASAWGEEGEEAVMGGRKDLMYLLHKLPIH